WSTSKTPSYTKSVSWQHHRGCGQECFDNMDSAKFISIIFWILAIISGIFAFMDNGSQKKDPQ
ncbi:hypothetical protein GR664_22780, partial [Klebsiella pneumoniae]|nr:hypothetical protein [Klebsiella pneumoniae]